MQELPQKYKSLFPYERARMAQIDGMRTIGKSAENNGIVTMEGACGTGKTLTALVPYIHKIRKSQTDYEQVLIVTSVKQQMKAFQDEIIRINNNIPDDIRSISAITLVSASDLHPFIEQGEIDSGDFNRIDSLREGTRKLADEKIHNYEYEDLHKRLDDGDEYMYPSKIPTADGIEYDPYYAKYRSQYDSEEDNSEEVLPFDPSSVGLMSANDLRTQCAEEGYCPHSMMRLSIDHMDLVVGNYMHVFDPKTVERVSKPVINNETLAIFDEAHNLVPRVREFLSKSVPATSIEKSKSEVEEIKTLIQLSNLRKDTVNEVENMLIQGQGQDRLESIVDENMAANINKIVENSSSVTSMDELYKNSQKIKDILDNIDITVPDIKKYNNMMDEILDVIYNQVSQMSSKTDGDSIRLRDPSDPSVDKLSEWIKLSSYNSICKKGEIIGSTIKLARDELTEPSVNVKTSSSKVGEIFSSWINFDHTKYYRSIEIKERYNTSGYGVKEWQSNLKSEITIHNCIPRDEISKILSVFGSSVLMSATLEPIDVYKKTTGIEKLEDEGQNVYECTYGLAFPEENRLTIGITADKFKYSNRGKPFTNLEPNTNNQTRKQYRDIIFDVINETPGNVLIVMPSYSEAEWVGSLLKGSYMCKSESVYVDESSTNQETEELKNKFFDSDNGVLVTGARGTLIEGIDYIGDKLKATVVCGVPITNTRSDYKVAIQASYDEIFDDTDGFTLAFTIPAVWKARQAIGRVIRTKKDIGTRILVDKRYIDNSQWDSVYEYLSPSEKEEISPIPPKDTDIRLKSFWDTME